MKVVIVVCAALFFGVLNSSGVTVIFPEMSAAFSVNAGLLSWVMSGYLLTYGIAIPFYGRLADKLGARPLFLAGIVLFSVGSVACLVAPTFEIMLGARVLQALGGAAFPGLGMAIASRAFPEEKRGVVLGAIGATIGIGLAVGPLVAGVVSNLVHWRAMFGMSALVILVFPLAWNALSRDDERADGRMDVVGGGFAMLNTPIAAIVSVMVRPAKLASALSINTIMFFVGSSMGAALFSLIVTANADALTAWTPLYSGPAINYSDAFGVLAIGVVLALAFIAPLPTKKIVEAKKAMEAALPGWTPDCSMPWSPDVVKP